jgi:multiple sugar transport system substrate-binding protein
MGTKEGQKNVSRRQFLRAAATAAGGIALVACGNTGTGATTTTEGGNAEAPSGGVANIKWSSWGNPGEVQRFNEYTKDWNSKNPNVQATFIAIPSDYEAKMLTQLSAGTAPDVFYTGDGFIGRLIANKTIIDLTELLNSSASRSKPEEFAEGLWGAAKTKDGKYYGVTVDCNPMIMWYNKKLLTDAGISQMPADMQKAGNWNWDTFQETCAAAVAAGKRGYVFESWAAHPYSFVTSNGGTIYDDSGAFVANTNDKAKEAYQMIYDNIQNKNFVYSGTLPQGQGADAQFLSQAVAFVAAGRWLLPVFKKSASLDYDIVVWPTNTGKSPEPAVIPTAYMVQNAKTASQDGAFAFLTNFVSKEGQTFRLQGGGNAVPSVSGVDNLVSEGNDPPNWQALIDARDVGYALYAEETSVPGLSQDLQTESDNLWLKGGDVQATLDKMAQIAKDKMAAAPAS